MRCVIPNAYILDITMYKKHVLLCSYYTIGILISKILTGTYEKGYTYVFEICCYRTLDNVLYIYIYIYIYCCQFQNMYVSVKMLKTLKSYAVMLRLVSDIFPMLILCS